MSISAKSHSVCKPKQIKCNLAEHTGPLLFLYLYPSVSYLSVGAISLKVPFIPYGKTLYTQYFTHSVSGHKIYSLSQISQRTMLHRLLGVFLVFHPHK